MTTEDLSSESLEQDHRVLYIHNRFGWLTFLVSVAPDSPDVGIVGLSLCQAFPPDDSVVGLATSLLTLVCRP